MLGFYSLDEREGAVDVAFFFVAPEAIRTGVGRRLWNHLEVTAQEMGAEVVHIESDPFAEPFYVSMGAQRIGTAPSGSIPDRVLPLLALRLDSALGRTPGASEER